MNNFSFEFYEGLPFEYEDFLIEKYKSFITNCRYISVYFPDEKHSYALVKINSQVSEIFVFGIDADSCNCYNSLVDIAPEAITAFTKSVFEKFSGIKKLKFSASYRQYSLEKSFLFSTANDYILDLPETLDSYYSKLGSTTRRHLKNYRARLLRDFPNVQFVVKQKNEIDKEVIARIVQLSYSRMKSKGIIPGKTQKDVLDFYHFSQYYGLVSCIEVDGEIIAGSISYVLGDRFFLFMIAHENKFSKYNPGQICIVNTIQTAIEMNLKTFHFLWGDNDYKMRFMAMPKPLTTYIFYRSYSPDFMLSKIKALLSIFLLNIRQSNFTKPLRDAIKNFRKKNT